jgi:hypothetical protein
MGGDVTYASYLDLDRILSAQHPVSGAHDEMLVIVVHQASELWLKLCLHELAAARELIAADDLRPAFKMLSRVARYADPRWFLDQFNCSLRNGACTALADRLVREALEPEVPGGRAAKLAEAEAALTLDNIYIPFGSPLRYSLVRSTVLGFAPNRWAFHPLPPLATIPR